jgi:hypothetical protein
MAGANTSGDAEKPSDPPLICSDIARPLRWLETACTNAAAGGWNAAPPRPPIMRTIPNANGVPARPTELSTITERIGPATRSTRGRQRSAIAPNASCETDEASWKHIASVPAIASESPSFGMSSGRRGA